MEPNISGISRKVWNIVRVAFFMIRKGICKKKMIMDLNMMMKRGKLAGKALGNLMFHHHHNHHNHHHHPASDSDVDGPSNNPNHAPGEYEFSCSNTPLYRQYFPKKRKNRHHQEKNSLEDCENVNLEEVSNMLDMMLRNEEVAGGVPADSPMFLGLGFGRSPAVRQLRITDSPFPVHNVEDDKHVDQAAEAFINKFYSQLKKQKY